MQAQSAEPISLTVNGQQQHCQVGNVLQLIEVMELAGKRIAVEKNGAIIPRSQYAETGLCDGDQLEIVIAVGGG